MHSLSKLIIGLSILVPLTTLAATSLPNSFSNSITWGRQISTTVAMTANYPKNWLPAKAKTGMIFYEDSNDLTSDKPWLLKSLTLQVADFQSAVTPSLDFQRKSFEAATHPKDGVTGGGGWIPSYTAIGSGSTTVQGVPALYWDFSSEMMGRTVNYRHISAVLQNLDVEIDWRTAPQDFSDSLPLLQSMLDSWKVTITKQDFTSPWQNSGAQSSSKSSVSSPSSSVASKMRKMLPRASSSQASHIQRRIRH